MQVNDEYTVTVEKFINDGKCICRVDNFPVFVEDVCPGDEIKIKIKKVNKSYSFADVTDILKKSEARMEPCCSMHKICGSCDRQFIKYEEQLKQKEQLVYENLKNSVDDACVFEKIIPSPKIFNYRCKIQFPVSQTINSKRILTGYYKKGSHELINIKYCPLQPDIVSEINEYFKEKARELGLSAYNEKIHAGLLRHVIYRISSDLSSLLMIIVVNSKNTDKKLELLADALTEKFPLIKGVCANYNTDKTNVITGTETVIIKGCDYYTEMLDDIKYRVSKTGFFQVNPYCAVKIFDKVKELVEKNTVNPSILDAYSGVSAFGIWLASSAKNVVSVEEVKTASEDAVINANINNVNNIKIINGDAAEQFLKLIKEGVKFDVSVTDPPRKGCSAESVNYLCQLTSKFIIYVSCNPVTLARDLKLFSEKGFKPLYVQPADMFPHTYHVETIVMLGRVNN